MLRKQILAVKGHTLDSYRLKRVEGSQPYRQMQELRSADMLSRFQQRYLQDVLVHAYQRVPFYHKLFDNLGIVPNETFDPETFNAIPVLANSTIRRCFETLVSDDCATRKGHESYTGGSTGGPLKFVHDASYLEWGRAVFYYYYKQILNIEEPVASKVILWGQIHGEGEGVRVKLHNWLCNTVLLNTNAMSVVDMDRVVRIINSHKPEIVRGYAGSLYELCKHIQHKNIPIHSPKALVSAAETLTSEMRQTIEEVWGMKVHNFYGSREIATIAGECDKGRMHVFPFWNKVEVLDAKGNSVHEGDTGNLVLTNLFNYSMPFIRYDIADMAVQGGETCPCGLALPTLKEILGKRFETFLLRDGTILQGQTFACPIGKNLRNSIEQFQVVQSDYETFDIYYVDKGKLTESEKKNLEYDVRPVVGDCTIRWHRVDEIPTLDSGKTFLTKSLLWDRREDNVSEPTHSQS
jgi:phenylacetate-CoA ligase